VSKKINTDLTIRAKQFGILLDDIAIVRLRTFPSIHFALKFIMSVIKISIFVTDGCVDSPGFWQGVHGCCGAEAGGSAGGGEGAICCGEGGVTTGSEIMCKCFSLRERNNRWYWWLL
jgi:hypothetical protein